MLIQPDTLESYFNQTYGGQTTSKANQSLYCLCRNLKINCKAVKEKTYKVLVRSKLEFCITVMNPHTKYPTEGCKIHMQQLSQHTFYKITNKTVAIGPCNI